uniref:Heme exporter protein D n=1 Tax=Steinernema glaseri TaxID=37863 RepID=A0A1I8A9F7_9BILA
MYDQTTSPTAVAVVWSMFAFLSLLALIYGLRMLWRRRQENRAMVAAIGSAAPAHVHHESHEEKTWKGLVDPKTIV